ncbi:MAG: nitroreductase family protein [Lentisphaeria bacterium]|nr:nitroreductase family protein [Lentisphaeria bacterium]
MEFDAVLQRRTIRFFEQRPVPEEELRYIIKAGTLASCGANNQPVRYLVPRQKELNEKIFAHTRYGAKVMPRRSPVWGVNAPQTFIAICTPNGSREVDAAAAVQSMQMAAWNHGIGCCWIGSFDRKEVTELLNPAEPLQILFLLALGYPAESPVTEEIGADEDVSYYLDDADVLHVPKLSVDAVCTWM